MSGTYIRYPATSGGVPVYTTLSAFPSTATNGSLAVAGDTDILYVYSSSLVAWEELASPGGFVAAPLTLQGTTDAVQLKVIANSIQTNDIFQIIDSTGHIALNISDGPNLKVFDTLSGNIGFISTNTLQVGSAGSGAVVLAGYPPTWGNLPIIKIFGPTPGQVILTGAGGESAFDLKNKILYSNSDQSILLDTRFLNVGSTNIVNWSTAGLSIITGYLTTDQLGATPTAPSAGFWQIYPKSDGYYVQSSAAVESKILLAGDGGINQLTSDVTAGPGSGSQAATVQSVGGSSAANVHSAELLANSATTANTASTIVKRDASGNFVTGTITGSLTGAASLNVLKAGDTMTGALVLSNTFTQTAFNGIDMLFVEHVTGTGAVSCNAIRSQPGLYVDSGISNTSTFMGVRTSPRRSSVANTNDLGTFSEIYGFSSMPLHSSTDVGGSPLTTRMYGNYIMPTANRGVISTFYGLYLDAASILATPATWAATTSYPAGTVIKPTSPAGHYFATIAGGTSGGSEPTWTTSAGSTVSDGSVTWIDILIPAITTRYGVYQNDSVASNFFLGNVGVGATSTGANIFEVTGNIAAITAGSGFKIKEGSNAKMGTATLSSGTVVVSTNVVTANSRIFLTPQSGSSLTGAVYVSTRSAGTSFTITSTDVLDSRPVAWMIVEPA